MLSNSSPSRRLFGLLFAGWFCVSAGWISWMGDGLRADDRPNFVFFIADDVSQTDLGCYGHPTIKTPHIDRMANEGLRFENAYLTISSCSPSRCSIITGRYPHNTGAPELHTRLPAGQFMFPAALRDAGYYTVLSGKNHMGPETKKAFDKISRGKGPGREEDWVEILKQRPTDRPFFCWFAAVDAHRDWQFNEAAPRYQPKDAVVPPYLMDGLLTRQDLADYYHEVSRWDHYVGKVVDELKRQGLEKNTYVIICADNGRPFPRCKTRLYDSGIKTPLIVRAPGKIDPGVTQSLVSSIDISATVLELAQLPSETRVQGVSFGKILDDPTATTRDMIFAEHNWHVFQAHERMVRSGDLMLIRNRFPDRRNMCVESATRFPAGKELWQAYLEPEKSPLALTPAQGDLFLENRPPLELYHVEQDPHQIKNLVTDPDYRGQLSELVQMLDQWERQTGDTVPKRPTPDRDDVFGKKVPGFRRGEMPGQSTKATNINRPGPVRKSDLADADK